MYAPSVSIYRVMLMFCLLAFELRAKCEGSSRSVVVTKWRNIDKWFDRFEGPSALSGDLSLKDWHWA